MEIWRLRNVTNFNFAPSDAIRLLRNLSKSFGDRVAAAGADDEVSTIANPRSDKGQLKRIAYVVNIREIADRRTVAINGQCLPIDRSPNHHV
jgi:hypothetical protein